MLQTGKKCRAIMMVLTKHAFAQVTVGRPCCQLDSMGFVRIMMVGKTMTGNKQNTDKSPGGRPVGEAKLGYSALGQ